jgi:hypothetical protein
VTNLHFGSLKRIVKQNLRLNFSKERISWVLKSTTTIMIYFFLGLAVLAFLLFENTYLCFDCYDKYLCLRYFWPRISITIKHLRSPNLDRVTELKIRLAIIRADSVLQERYLSLFIPAVIELDVVILLILFCALSYCLRGPPRNELDAQILSHRNAALRLMVFVVLLESLLLFRILAKLLTEAASLAWGVYTILWAYVSNVIRTGAIGDGEAVVNEIIAKFYWS